MGTSGEGQTYANVNPGVKSVSPGGSEKASFRTYRLVGVSFGLLCVLQVMLNVTLRLYANTKIDSQTNISLLIEEKKQLQNNYTNLLTEINKLQQKLEDTKQHLSQCFPVTAAKTLQYFLRGIRSRPDLEPIRFPYECNLLLKQQDQVQEELQSVVKKCFLESENDGGVKGGTPEG